MLSEQHINQKYRGDSTMKSKADQRLEAISSTTLIVGVDIAKAVHWARFTDYRGMEIGKAISFNCDRQGFDSIVARIEMICNL